MTEPRSTFSRRQALQALAGLGIGSAVFQRALIAQVEKTQQVTPEMIEQAEWIAGLNLTEAERKAMAFAMRSSLRNFEQMRKVELTNDVPLALGFEPAPWLRTEPAKREGTVAVSEPQKVAKPNSEEELAFLSVVELAELVRTRKVTSTELTKLYLKRLRKYDPFLLCVVNYTEELALKQAKQADTEIAAGKYRGPLHGIPWGAKDLIAYPGYPTTWGAPGFREQMLDTKATVAKRLEEAGAVLVAKLSLGALASGDKWFGGQTRNPWNPRQGSSGSSAGSACAVAGGLVGFAIGSETLGSIISPSRRCGTNGLRPTFGRVSRHGCMTLSWSMDKLGPLARSIEDCALIFGAIHGADGLDISAVDRPFSWPMQREVRGLRVGYFANRTPEGERRELNVLRELGVKLVPIALPNTLPENALRMILFAEAATAFDDLTRKGETEGLNNWPNHFRQAEFTPAVEYLRANRIRSKLMHQMRELMETVDLYVGGDDLMITNLTGHPTAIVPNGVRGENTPMTLTFTGRLYGEEQLLAVAHAYQQATGHHRHHPDMSKLRVVPK